MLIEREREEMVRQRNERGACLGYQASNGAWLRVSRRFFSLPRYDGATTARLGR